MGTWSDPTCPGEVAAGRVPAISACGPGRQSSLAVVALASAAANTFPWMLVFCCVWQPQKAAWTLARGKYLYIRACSVQWVRPVSVRCVACFVASILIMPAVCGGTAWGHGGLWEAVTASPAPPQQGHPDGSRTPSIPVGKFTVNIFAGTLSSFWQCLSVCWAVKLRRRASCEKSVSTQICKGL